MRTGSSARAFELLEPLVQAATVRVHAPPDGYETPGTGPTWGSGFFVAPGWVLTCAHVVGEGGGAVRLVGREVGITFSSGGHGATGTVAGRVECVLPERLERHRPGRRSLWDLPDLALVRVLAPITHACVWLTDRARPRLEEAAYFGCTEDLGVPEITGRTTRLRGTAANGAAIRLGDDDEIEPGMSGGPVVDLARGEVVGVVKARRHTGGGGLAVSVAQLRTLPMAATGQTGLYRRVMQAHDLYHYDQHLSDLDSRRTWTDVHDELPAGDGDPYGGRRLTPGERTTLCGLLAELPPPGSSEAVRELAEAARGEEPDPALPAPLNWRDGLGLLHDPPGGAGEAVAMLRYATDVSVADYREPPSPGADEELWDWVRATAERLWRPLRRELAERHERGLAERARRRRRSAGHAVHGPARPAGVLPTGPSVLLEAWAHGWEDVYDWRVSVLAGPARPGLVTPVESGVRATLAALPEVLRAPLAEGFRRCDTHEAAALLEVAVAPELFGLAVDEWAVAGGVPVGVQRPVVFRHASGGSGSGSGSGSGTGTGVGAEAAAGRWTRVQAGPLLDERADCVRGRPRSPDPGWLAGLADNTVPVHCRAAALEPTLGALHVVREAGYGVAVCRRPPEDPGVSCAPFHRGLREELAEAGRGAALPVRMQALRARAHGSDPDAYWAAGAGLVWDDPARPLPEDEPLQGDL
ncbi:MULTISPECIES: trypsin-like peptidase domain-containing protein [unclassified Streptomyces]|uniref:VMAP-C domain-containing protein n=1 Tax=unclassified Streptomyces TaxID=2593676 RepID=UPI001BE9E13A|nr:MULTISPECIES: trypsin-like peptidase domain-containing protein [unclassified Streptomyces]MBT2406764.1 trypsin-like peptidase domain-containing protein [Streptomyces sp. ISL-21]MBT2608960.1 trypsin-like peptidase domain-containing protein [Streptomyces sp. ISL-87]